MAVNTKQIKNNDFFLIARNPAKKKKITENKYFGEPPLSTCF